MKNTTQLRTLVLALAALSTGGCYSYSTVKVTVRDNLTSAPIPGAKVGVGYLEALNLASLIRIHPKDSETFTGVDGVATVSVARAFYPPFVDVMKQGYASDRPLIRYKNENFENIEVRLSEVDKQQHR